MKYLVYLLLLVLGSISLTTQENTTLVKGTETFTINNKTEKITDDKFIPIEPVSNKTTEVPPTTTSQITTTSKATTTVSPSTSTIPITTSSTSASTTTKKSTTQITTPITPVSTTKTPSTTNAPPVSTTVKPPEPHRRFDGPSFVGGIVLALGLVAIGFVAFKFYKARLEVNYHTL